MKITEETITNYVKEITNPNTRKTYRLSLNKFLNYLAHNETTEINQENINQIIHDYKTYLNTQKYKAATMNHHLIVLKTFINDYTSLYYDKKLKLVKTEKRKPKYLTLAQIQTALKYVDDKTDELIIKLLATTGLRINEALKITKKELKNTDENGNALITIVGKNNKRRIIVINPQLVKELKSYSKNNKKYVFESRNFQQRSIRNIQYRFNKLARKIDEIEDTKIYSENLKPHNLRHSFAIEALKTNEINYVKEFLGHENISTTQIYTNLKEEEVIGRFKNIKIF